MSRPTNGRTRTASVALLAVAALAFVLLRLPYATLPLERDEGEYAYVAQRMLAGDVPYRDAFDQKPPGIFAVYALALGLFGESEGAIRGSLYAWTAATAVALHFAARALAGPLAAAFAVLVFAVSSTDPRMMANVANTEHFVLLPMVLSLGCLLRALRDGRTRWWLACGALAGTACCFKQVAAVHAAYLGVAAVLVLARRPRGGTLAVRALAGMGAGALAVLLPVALVFAARGALEPFLDAVIRHNIVYAGEVSWEQGWFQLRVAAGRLAPGLGVLALLAAAGAALPGRGRALLAGFAVASLAAVSIGLYFRPHYFVLALPALAVLSGVALAAAARPLLRRRAPLAAAGVAALCLLVLAPPVLANRTFLTAPSQDALAREIWGDNPFPEARRIGRYIGRTSAPEDTVYVVGSEPEIFFYAGRESATRYIYFYPLLSPFADARPRQEEALAEVAERRPLYVVWVNISTSLMLRSGSDPHVLEASAALLEREYALELLAHPVAGEASFRIDHGVAARRLLRAARVEGVSAPWVAVYRRRP